MPRIFDKLDAEFGRKPQAPEGIDYLTQAPGPDVLIGDDGTYNAGWFQSFEGKINLDQSRSLNMALQRWFHLTFDAPDHFVVCNLADLSRAGNVALLVANKRTGQFEHGSVTKLGPNNRIEVTHGGLNFVDQRSGSFIRTNPSLSEIHVSLHVDDLHFMCVARHVLGPHMIQATRFQRGRGSLQWYSNVELVHGLLSINGKINALPPGTLGSVDRTMGHQRGLQNWNWVAMTGTAWDETRCEMVRFGLQVAKDRELAQPVVSSKKYVVWLDEGVYKLPSASFHYTLTNPETRETSAWQIVSDAPGDSWIDLQFTPRFQRRELRQKVLAQADFNQYYGEATGKVRVAGRTLVIDRVFAVTEDSLLEV